MNQAYDTDTPLNESEQALKFLRRDIISGVFSAGKS